MTTKEKTTSRRRKKSTESLERSGSKKTDEENPRKIMSARKRNKKDLMLGISPAGKLRKAKLNENKIDRLK